MKTKRLDNKDMMLLQLLYNQDHDPSRTRKPGYSITELRDNVPGVKSVGTIHSRLKNLEEQGYIVQPSHKQPRSRFITNQGIRELKKEVPQV